MKFLAFSFLITLFLISPEVKSSASIDHSSWDQLLKQYVKTGLVDYQRLLEAKVELDRYLEGLASISVDTLGEASREERLAFWINLYNASVVRMVLEEYPIERFDQIPAAFDIRTIRALGEFFSLRELRDEIIRLGFRDERILTALVSARLDSPKLFPEAFRSETLDDQLNRAARNFIEDESRNLIRPGEKRIFLSPMFKQFGRDFLLNYGSADSSSSLSPVERAVVSFLLDHLQNPEKRLFLDSGRYHIDYLPENPRLNDVAQLPG